jgi:hypothetical protein
MAGTFDGIATVTGTSASATASDTEQTRFRVTALNASGESGPSNTVTNTPVIAPPPTNLAAPTNLRAVLVTPHRIDLEWTSSLTAATEVERAYLNAPFAKIATVSAGTLHYSDTSAFKKNSYMYRARSVNAGGPSPYSNSAYFYGQ